MTEDDYIAVSNLAKLRVAEAALRLCFPAKRIDEAAGLVSLEVQELEGIVDKIQREGEDHG